MWMIRSSEPVEVGWVSHQWHPLMSGLAKVLLPTLGMVALAAVALNVLQTGLLFLPNRVAPDLSRLNPLNGWRRIFSADNTVRLSLGLLKLGILGTVAFASIYQRRGELVSLGSYDLPRVAELVWQLTLSTSLKVGSAMLILALADYGFERWRYERELKMSPQELREELRNMQGDPQIAARRRIALREKGLGNPSPTKRHAA
jgi:flagellar biosynthetic protein FlhB